MRLDLALRLLDLPADHLVLDRVVFLHAEHAHQSRNAFAHEDADQIVFQRQIETARTRIALAAGTATQLVVDAARFVPFGADDAQAAERDDLVVALLPLGAHAVALSWRGLFRQRLQLRVEAAAEHDIGAAAGHVGRDGDRLRTARLRDDVRFALVLLRVQHFMRHAMLLQQPVEQLGHFDRCGADEHRLAALVAFLDVLDDRVVLRIGLEENDVRLVLAHHRPMRRNHDHLEPVRSTGIRRLRYPPCRSCRPASCTCGTGSGR